jgi:hypothetical protein
MLSRRSFARLVGSTALTGCAGGGASLSAQPAAQSAAAAGAVARGSYLIRNGAVITVDPALGVLPS